MGVEPFMVTASMTCVVAQRLVRRLCKHCAKPTVPTPQELEAAGWSDDLMKEAPFAEPKWHEPAGCNKCGNSGYKGRFGVHEVLLLSPTIQNMILDRTSNVAIKEQAVSEGMITMRQDGLIKAATGMTSLVKLARAVA